MSASRPGGSVSGLQMMLISSNPSRSTVTISCAWPARLTVARTSERVALLALTRPFSPRVQS